MADDHSITAWIHCLKANQDSMAAQHLWQQYMERLAHVAKRKLGRLPRRVSDEEDVALSAFAAFLEGNEKGRFAKLEDRDDLWQILIMITERKSIELQRREHASKRGAGQVRGESIFAVEGEDKLVGMEQLPDQEPTPEFAAEVSEQLAELLRLLGDEQLRQIAFAKLEGCTNQEIADQMHVGLRSIERKLSIIRHKWQHKGMG